MVRLATLGAIVATLLLLCLSGCRGSKTEVAAAPSVKDRFAKWPEDTIERPEFLAVVDRQAGHVKGDAEPARVPSRYQIPDWAEPTSPISMKGPKRSRLTFHLLPRIEPLRKRDDARLARLLAGETVDGSTLVIARPWIGWYGQAGGENTLRVYTLFANNRQLEIHLEWPTGNKEAFDEGQSLLAHLVYSLAPVGA